MANFDLATLRTITILYVEDEDFIREQSAKAYNKLFKKVFVAENGLEALEIFKINKNIIDIVVTDINMPKLSGLELSKKIVEIAPTPIIITTAYTHTEYMLDAIDLGIKKYVTKPITLNGIVQDIEKVVIQHRKESNIKDIAKTLLVKSKSTSSEINTLVQENQTLEKTMSFYKTIVDKYVAMVKIDKNGVILKVSKNFTTLLSYSETESIGKNISKFKDTSCTNIPFQKQMLEAIHKKTAITSTHTLKSKDNKLLNFEVNMILFYGNDSLIAGYDLYFSPIHQQTCSI